MVEPNIETHHIFKLTAYNEAAQKADIVVFLVAHKQFKNLALSEEKTVLDFCGISEALT